MLQLFNKYTVYIYIYIFIIRVHHVQKYTRALLPHAALRHSTKVHAITNNQVTAI